MADWTDIANATLEPDAPLISATMLALRDNPQAIAEGASGAPRIVNEGLDGHPFGADDFQSGTAERDWVLARAAGASVGALGSYALLYTLGTKSPGSTQSGSVLTYASAGAYRSSTQPAGTWRCMGASDTSSGTDEDRGTTLWLRIS